jgi:hypothetical protein
MESYKLQYASDLHLDADSPPFSVIIEPAAADLALCGDIGSPWSPVYAAFLKWCAARWQRVFLIAGNHEYFTSNSSKTYEDTENQIRAVAAGAGMNVIYLQRDSYRIDAYKIIVIGATLWTEPDIRRWDMMSSGVIGGPGCRGEYDAIWMKDEYTGKPRNLHPSDVIQLHLRDREFFSRFLNNTWGTVADMTADGWRIIVLSHHLPSYSLNPAKFAGHPLVSCYATALDGLIKEPVVAWLCGHSHTAMSKRFDAGPVVALNPLGYKSEAGTTGYSRNAFITVYRENIAIARNGQK